MEDENVIKEFSKKKKFSQRNRVVFERQKNNSETE